MGSHLSYPSKLCLLIHALDRLVLPLFLSLFIAFRDHKKRRVFSDPPGPLSRPIIGNLFDVLKRAPRITYMDIMSKKYGLSKDFHGTSPKPMLTSQGDVYLSPHFLSYDRRIVLVIGHQGSTREARRNQ
jgi:hypothetical protein